MVIHCHEQELPAGAIDRIAPIARYTMTHAFNTSEFLGIDMDEVSRVFVLIAHHGLSGLQLAQPRKPGPAQYPSDRARGQTQACCNACLSQTPAPQLDDRQRLLRRDRARAFVRTRGAIVQAGFTLRQVAGPPLARGRFAHPSSARRLRSA